MHSSLRASVLCFAFLDCPPRLSVRRLENRCWAAHAGMSGSGLPGRTGARKITLTPLTDPDAFARGWAKHPVARTGPRFTIGRAALSTNGSGDRKTWMDAAIKEKVWIPGPGAHATERSFYNSDNHEMDAKRCVEDARPDYSFSRATWEPALTQAEVKPKRNSFRYPKFDPWFTPGPGAHTQFTVFDNSIGSNARSG
ncbi:hypothetical protein AK812_SmicGene14840 [Symbiodinium microadriaticum]|uniref:Uncharacterized protein n=1 Tax=Symbiodinium microadriaticum TaxID=2951 RepID=A0A1Q9E4I9_SYMMI|nr:hypothetical protein AK812_SmicGene14840 [Symbiodinium microadriaticum]